MAKAIALTKTVAADPVEIARMVFVYGCALALIAAGPMLPL